MTSASDEKWRPFNCFFFQSGQAKDLSAPLYLGTALTNQNSTDEEIKKRLTSNVYYHSVQDLLSSSLLSRSIKIKTGRIITLPVVLQGAEPSVSHWRRNIGWWFLRTGCWGRYLGLKRDEITRNWRRIHNGGLHDLRSSSSIIHVLKRKRMRWAENVARMGEETYVQGFSGETWRKETTWKT